MEPAGNGGLIRATLHAQPTPQLALVGPFCDADGDILRCNSRAGLGALMDKKKGPCELPRRGLFKLYLSAT